MKSLSKAIIVSIALTTSGCAIPTKGYKPTILEQKVHTINLEGRLKTVNGIQVITLDGTPYEKGYQAGALLKEPIKKGYETILNRTYSQIPGGKIIGPLILDHYYNKINNNIQEKYKKEMQGLADGAGISLKKVQRITAIPTVSSNIETTLKKILPNFLKKSITCSSFAAWGKATIDGNLYMTRNLDWDTESKIYEVPLITVYKDEGFVNIGYAGLIGVLSGMNKERISVAEIGAITKAQTYEGTPMIFLLRQILEEAKNLEDAIKILTNAKRTSGFNYVIGDGKTKKAVAIETNAENIAWFKDNDEKEKNIPYAIPIENVVFRADTAMNQEIRKPQLCTGGWPNFPTGKAYNIRYKKSAELIKKNYGIIDEKIAMKIAGAVAPKTNIQSVIYSPSKGEFWIANATDEKKATHTNYNHFTLQELFGEQKR